MQNTKTFTLPAVLLLAFCSEHAMGQNSRRINVDVQSSLAGSALTCTQPTTFKPMPTSIRVPPPLVERAKLKARLLTLLRESLFDDASGIVNIAREKEIKRLANRLEREEEY